MTTQSLTLKQQSRMESIQVLEALREANRAMTVRELVAITRLDRGAVTNYLRKLRGRGFVVMKKANKCTCYWHLVDGARISAPNPLPSDLRAMILAYIADHGACSGRELAREFGVNEKVMAPFLGEMERAGAIQARRMGGAEHLFWCLPDLNRTSPRHPNYCDVEHQQWLAEVTAQKQQRALRKRVAAWV